MRGGGPTAGHWSDVVIDVAKDMLGFGLTGLGDVNIGDNKLRTTNLLLKEGNATTIFVRNAADGAFGDLAVDYLIFTDGLVGAVNGAAISPPNVNDNYIGLFARDSGTGQREVARLQGAAVAYFNLISGRARMDDIDLRKQMLIWSLIGG